MRSPQLSIFVFVLAVLVTHSGCVSTEPTKVVRVSGTVIGADRKPVVDAWIWVWETAARRWPLSVEADSVVASASTDECGKFAVEIHTNRPEGISAMVAGEVRRFDQDGELLGLMWTFAGPTSTSQDGTLVFALADGFLPASPKGGSLFERNRAIHETREKRKAAEPGATDNPDGAQRLREDH